MALTKLVRMVAVDPGSAHCGVAMWLGESMYATQENTPGEYIVWLRDSLLAKALDELVIEEYRLYPWKSKEQSFSQIGTVEVIGVTRYLCADAGVPMVEQPASIKKPTFAIMRKRGVVLPKGSQHIKDAIAHGFYRINRGTIPKGKADEAG